MEGVGSQAIPVIEHAGRSRFVLLCRHGYKAPATGLGQARGLSPDGVENLLGVVDRLVETLEFDGIRVTAACHGAEREVLETTGLLYRGLVAAGVADPDSWLTAGELDPSGFARDPAASVEQVKSRIVEYFCESDEPLAAVLVVGHEPQLSWIAHALRKLDLRIEQDTESGVSRGSRVLRQVSVHLQRPIGWAAQRTPRVARARLGTRPGDPALTHAEIRCVAIPTERRWRARSRIEWSIAPTDDKGTELLREKIRSKMGIAQLLGAFITLVLSGVVLDPDRLNDLGRDWTVSVSAALFLGAIGLYAATMYAYDSLLMPSRFWAESPATRHAARRTVRRPPSSVNWILYQNMLRVWNWLFTPASVLVFVGLLLLAYAALQPRLSLALGTGVVAALAAVYVRWFRPDIGSED